MQFLASFERDGSAFLRLADHVLHHHVLLPKLRSEELSHLTCGHSAPRIDLMVCLYVHLQNFQVELQSLCSFLTLPLPQKCNEPNLNRFKSKLTLFHFPLDNLNFFKIVRGLYLT
jgi:hypothetical protein